MSDPRELDAHPWFREDPDAWVRRIVSIHFHPEQGSPYWIGKAAAELDGTGAYRTEGRGRLVARLKRFRIPADAPRVQLKVSHAL